MESAMRTLVIIPAFNEARGMGRLISEIQRSAPPGCDICVVDDGSTDATRIVVAQTGVLLLRCPLNLGIGGAVQTGYLWAVDHSYAAAVQVDGDAQHNPRFIDALLAPIARGEADMVVGSRFLEDGGFRSTWLRRVGIRYLRWILRTRCGARATDPTSGFRATGRLATELFARYYPSDYPEPEAIALAVRGGLRVKEIPVEMRERAHGVSSINFWRSIYYLVKVSAALMLLPRSHPSPQLAGVDGEAL